MSEEAEAKKAIIWKCLHCNAENYGEDTLEYKEKEAGLLYWGKASDNIDCCHCGKENHVIMWR